MSNGQEPTGAPARPTLESVAAVAGVSRGTASRALNGGAHVSPKAMRAVERAAAALAYRPNQAARSLVRGRSDSVGLVVSESDDRLFTDPFFAAVVRGIHAELAASGTQLVLSLAQSQEERGQMLRFAAARHLDGVLLISMRVGDPLPQALIESGTPVVLAGRGSRSAGSDGLCWVDADNRGGARKAVRHLLARGRTKIATVAGPADLLVGQDRLEGWRDALRAAQGSAPRSLIERGDFTLAAGRQGARRLLEREPDIDAVFAANDLIALGVLQLLRESGRRVPDDVALVGFDDIPAAATADPPLTTVVQPVTEMGRRMAQLLLRKVNGEIVDPPYAVLPTELVIRDST